ncbi:MAG: ribosome small subunit-dependent GTPase A [Spirochaetales bacterium]|uniref:Small ribosomal subunit biogenesis GTPase RsgA n=1 Tax=Candidatus Thalassospirochaeta sargassi TaxID=3119039 RepID=A0AAJ1IFG4_9SPIO|nr:ribosome small subunit-dependent GTPase A [Spirochaetales bacterium]
MRGLVLYGINNIYTVKSDSGLFECRIKGKQLKSERRDYNPICSGDFVEIEEDENHTGKGMITSRHDRGNSFARWNRKRGRIQTIASNIDLLVCILSPESPPFRPRFADRVLVNAEDNFPVLIVLNKIDQESNPEVDKRISNWESMGYKVIRTSVKTGFGIEELKNQIKGKTAAFVGQSGVGKSSLLNSIEPGLKFRVGSVSEKFNKGTHTTCYAVLDTWDDGVIIDTPGIKEIDPVGIEPETLSHFMRDFKPYIGECTHSVCLHRDEPGCAVKDAVENEEISAERYNSYLRILSDLEIRIKQNKYRKEV